VPVVFIYDPGGSDPCHAVIKDVRGPFSLIREGFCGAEPCFGPVPWCEEPVNLCRRCASVVEKTEQGWRVKAMSTDAVPRPEPDIEPAVGD
jgi:hypothetical protein